MPCTCGTAAASVVRAPSVATGYQSNSSFEPSVAAVIIAGMPIAIAASAKTRPSIMIFPVTSPASFDASDRNRFADQHLPRACFRRIASRILWFRGLWRKPGQRFAVCGRNSTLALRVGSCGQNVRSSRESGRAAMRLRSFWMCEGFRMPAPWRRCDTLRGPAYENLQGRKPRLRGDRAAGAMGI